MKINKQGLLAPQQYLSAHGIKVSGKSGGPWRLVTCPIHKGGQERNPSMGFNLITGGYFCHACGAKGGDLIDFHRARTGLGFVNAVIDLGGSFDEN